MKIHNFIFDNSGTLNDNFKNVYLASMFVFKRLGIKMLSLEGFRNKFKIPYIDFYREYTDVSKKQIDEWLLMAINHLPKPQLFFGVRDTLEFLRIKRKRMAILSFESQESLEKQIQDNDLKSYFLDVLGGIHDKAEALNSLIDYNYFLLNKTVYVGDTVYDIEAAKQIGIKAVAIAWGLHSKRRLRKAKPDFLINDILEIKKIIA